MVCSDSRTHFLSLRPTLTIPFTHACSYWPTWTLKCLVSFIFLFFSEVTIKVYQTAEETVFSLVNLASFRVSMETLHHAGFTFTVPSIHIHWKGDSTFSSNKTLHRKKYKCDLFNGSNFPSSLSLAVNI